MARKYYRNCAVICVMAGIILSLTGCGLDPMPDLTAEESAMISEYAVGVLLKHDINAGKLASDYEIAEADRHDAELQAKMEEMRRLKAEQEENETESSGSQTGEDQIETAQPVFEGIAQFYGLDGFQIDYIGYQICDSYPESNDVTDKVFAMDAAEGKKLLVLQFVATNDMPEDRELDMFDANPHFRVAVNDGKPENVLSTMLLDDLAMYKDVVPAQTGVQLILVKEIPTEEASSIQTISLTCKNESESATTLLK